ncbi:AraC family transcriptional regulator [Roseibium sp. MMSF_3412]|uniref:AraC family transcriptional regulator n=1 Tax=Roseibium sp. MMSF_3412 TaxID=3046712 RepID=UPI00273E8BB0|nr:AraC family transcriptional regulator [Roseibium sp. MMSF_3412]
MLRTARNLPLGDFNCFETFDVDEAREIVARKFCSHRLERMSASDRFNACQNRVEGKRLSLNYIRYGADVTIDPGELSDFYLIQIPIAGTADVQNGTRSVWSSPSTGVVLNPDRNTTMRWHAGCEQVLVQIERSYVAEIATRMTGIGLNAIRFKPGLHMNRGPIAVWTRRLRGLFGAAASGQIFRHPDDPCQRQLEEALVTSLLEVQANTASHFFKEPAAGTAPAILKRAMALINERFDQDISLLDICAFAGTTPRNLQIHFKRELGCSPMEKLQDIRFNFARHLLLSDSGSLSVSEIAEMSGHRHAGRFSQGYKMRFQETPRQTLRRRRFC